MEKFARFAWIAETGFSDIVISTHDLGHKLRIYLKDKSFIDFFYATKARKVRFAIHLERSHLDNSVYRIDNVPYLKWNKVKTFPIRFHSGKYNKVEAPPFKVEDFDLETVLREFLTFTQSKIIQKG